MMMSRREGEDDKRGGEWTGSGRGSSVEKRGRGKRTLVASQGIKQTRSRDNVLLERKMGGGEGKFVER